MFYLHDHSVCQGMQYLRGRRNINAVTDACVELEPRCSGWWRWRRCWTSLHLHYAHVYFVSATTTRCSRLLPLLLSAASLFFLLGALIGDKTKCHRRRHRLSWCILKEPYTQEQEDEIGMVWYARLRSWKGVWKCTTMCVCVCPRAPGSFPILIPPFLFFSYLFYCVRFPSPSFLFCDGCFSHFHSVTPVCSRADTRVMGKGRASFLFSLKNGVRAYFFFNWKKWVRWE